jgi:hypothetical protein
MNTPIDLYSDPGHATLRVLLERHPGAVPLLKGAEAEDNREQIPMSAFAWPERKLYPVHSVGQAITSYLYAKHAASHTKTASLGREVPLVPREVLASIEESLDAYGVDLKALEPVAVKVAALTDAECLFPEAGTYPVRNAHEVKVAEQALLGQVGKLRPETRVRVFSKLASAADQHGVELQAESNRWAGRTYTDRTALAATLEGRAMLCKTAEQEEPREQFLKLAATVRREPLREPLLRAKLAGAISKLDQRAGITRSYDRDIPDPMATVFNTSTKQAAGDIDLNGRMVSRQMLAALPTTFYADALGRDIVPEITSGGQVDLDKLGQVLATLPADMKTSFGRNLQAAGIRLY